MDMMYQMLQTGHSKLHESANAAVSSMLPDGYVFVGYRGAPRGFARVRKAFRFPRDGYGIGSESSEALSVIRGCCRFVSADYAVNARRSRIASAAYTIRENA